MVTRVAILDDYQKVAERSADWSVLPKGVEVTFFHDHLDDPDRLVARLAPFEVIGIMRERTPFPGALLERLPNLRCLITTGPRNASIDVAAAQRLGVTVCGTRSSGHATAELAMALILALARGLPAETASMRAGGWQVGLGRDLRRCDARRGRPRPARQPAGQDRPGVRHDHDRLEPEPHGGGRGRARRAAGPQGGAVPPCRLRLGAPAAQRRAPAA